MIAPRDDRRAIDLAIAEWLTKLGRKDGEQYRRSFEAWLSERSEHRVAYQAFVATDRDVAGTSFPVPRLHPQPRPVLRTPFAQAAIAAAIVLGVGGGATYLALQKPSHDAASGTRFAAGDAPRAIELADGTSLMLDTHAVMLTAFVGDRPILLLEQGRARVRFPAHADRPFVVAAGDLRLTAHGAVFDIARDADTVRVTALGGAIIAQHEHGLTSAPIAPGQQLVANSTGDRLMPADKNEASWTSALLPLDGKTLADLVAIGNRTGGKTIMLPDAELGRRPVQGQLPVKNTHALALQIAAAFDLNVRETPDQYILTRKS